ncbi:hypothetical protein X777_16351 [Ooceraea biroi]|uniref:Uncharacterized protein n=1 Tax=Ooceraea biroi TaxID=2015173 RepID=A0A026VU97_OOCBI|nr:hypothetical protein X777_16351 [Ooceraea biroi]
MLIPAEFRPFSSTSCQRLLCNSG